MGDYSSYLQELCSALLPCLADNNVKIATQAAGVVELLCGGGLPEGGGCEDCSSARISGARGCCGNSA